MMPPDISSIDYDISKYPSIPTLCQSNNLLTLTGLAINRQNKRPNSLLRPVHADSGGADGGRP